MHAPRAYTRRPQASPPLTLRLRIRLAVTRPEVSRMARVIGTPSSPRCHPRGGGPASVTPSGPSGPPGTRPDAWAAAATASDRRARNTRRAGAGPLFSSGKRPRHPRRGASATEAPGACVTDRRATETLRERSSDHRPQRQPGAPRITALGRLPVRDAPGPARWTAAVRRPSSPCSSDACVRSRPTGGTAGRSCGPPPGAPELGPAAPEPPYSRLPNRRSMNRNRFTKSR